MTVAELNGPATRTNNFRADPTLPDNERFKPKDYSKSGYDQGHMAPAEDFTRSTEAMSTTFLLSNMAPQTPGLNRNRWKQLENAVRRVVKSQGSVWLFSGSIFIGSKPIEEIGKDKVAVPTHFFKVILCVHPDGSKVMFASVMPNITKLQPGLAKYATSVDNVEQLTGIDFFGALPAAEQKTLEAKVNQLP
jgi:endonuclease G, mitochondrial